MFKTYSNKNQIQEFVEIFASNLREFYQNVIEKLLDNWQQNMAKNFKIELNKI